MSVRWRVVRGGSHGLMYVTRLLGIPMLCLSLLAGCAGMQAYREGKALLAEGKYQQGLAKLEEAVREDPRNTEYRMTLGMRRANIINGLLASAERAQREDKLGEAEAMYTQVVELDDGNAMARQGLGAIAAERRHRLLVQEASGVFKEKGVAGTGEALDKLRAVLTENPAHKSAQELKAHIDEVRFRESRIETKLAVAFRKPISLQFRDAPIRSVMDLISQVSGLSFFFDPEVRPDLRATVLAKDTSIEDALNLILTTAQLRYKVLNDSAVLIYPNTPQKVKDYQALMVRSFFLANADAKAIANTLKTLVKTQDLVVDERLGLVMMRDTPEAIRMAEKIVALQDVSDPEVMLEVEILEIKRTRLMELGVQWPSQLTLSPLQLNNAPLTLQALRNIDANTTQAVIGSMTINARKEDTDANILANPRIRVRNKEKAKVMIGDKVPVITTTASSTGFVAESVNYLDVGLKLEVEPNIYLDDEVAIKINLEVSTLVREVLSKGGTLSYQIGSRGANTVLRLKNGETQILAGLINDEDRSTANKVPLIGELPVVGRLFGSQKDDGQRSEILLSITPRVVRSIRRPDMLSAEFDSGTESSIGARPLRLMPVELPPNRAGGQMPPQRGGGQ